MCHSMRNRSQGNILAPKPVHPTAVRFHGLFGIPYVRQHMIMDDRWTPVSLTEEFSGMADLLSKRLIFKKLESNATRKRQLKENRCLKHQCRDGRTKLHMILDGDNTKQIRNFLINHKDMQRLYQKMPVHLVVDNINQRTFVMRKERDRLRFRLDQLKEIYEKKLLERAILENRIKYENEFILEEEIKSQEFRKKIENSHVRLKAIKTIHGTYKKMIQVLRHDAIFYEPILKSLNRDIEDQAAFIKHILYIGTPAISKFRELSEEYRIMEEKSRKDTQTKLSFVANYKRGVSIKRLTLLTGQQQRIKNEETVHNLRRYVRETDSMQTLIAELELIEGTIKQMKFVTLCSQAKEIYPRMKSQIDNNYRLRKLIDSNINSHTWLGIKMKRAEVFQGVLVNNLSEEEISRLERIAELEQLSEEADKEEAILLQNMKNRFSVFLLLRFSMWNIHEILRYVERPARVVNYDYPRSYLKLPLLKFEMLTMRACPPEKFEENLDTILRIIKRKVQRLMTSYDKELTQEELDANMDQYHNFVISKTADEAMESDHKIPQEEEEDLLGDAKTLQTVPNRKLIKHQSAKIMEEQAKKEEL